MRRRRLIRIAAATAGTLTPLAGCAQKVDDRSEAEKRENETTPPKEQTPVNGRIPELPVEEKSEVYAARIEELHGVEIEDEEGLAETLDEHGVVEPEAKSEENGEFLSLEYVAADLEGEGLIEDVGAVAGAYASLVSSGYDRKGLEATVLDGDGGEIGSYHVWTEWAVEYDEGRTSAEEYGEKVVGTMETKAG